jgi:hypothetical protein
LIRADRRRSALLDRVTNLFAGLRHGTKKGFPRSLASTLLCFPQAKHLSQPWSHRVRPSMPIVRTASRFRGPTGSCVAVSPAGGAGLPHTGEKMHIGGEPEVLPGWRRSCCCFQWQHSANSKQGLSLNQSNYFVQTSQADAGNFGTGALPDSRQEGSKFGGRCSERTPLHPDGNATHLLTGLSFGGEPAGSPFFFQLLPFPVRSLQSCVIRRTIFAFTSGRLCGTGHS